MKNFKLNLKALATKICTLSASLLLLAASSLSYAEDLAPYSAQYQGQYKGMTLTLERKFEALGKNRYSVKNEASSGLASFYESSDFSLFADNRIQPTAYEYTTKFGPIVKKQDVVFDWKNKTVYDKEDKKKKPIVLKDSLADKISFQILLRQMLKQDKKGKVTISLFNRGRLKTYDYSIGKIEAVKTQAGTFQAIPVKRIYDDAKESQTMWFAKDKDFALIKYYQKDDDGQVYEISLKKISLSSSAKK